MNPKSGNPLPNKIDWKRFLKSAETLITTSSLSEQSASLTGMVAELFGLTAKFWYAHPLYPLPGDEAPDLIDAQSDLPSIVKTVYENRIPFYMGENGFFSELMGKELISSICLPVQINSDLLGILLLESEDEVNIPQSVHPEISAFVHLCALSLQIHRQTVLKNWRMEQLSIVRTVSDKAANMADLDQLCRQVTDSVRDTFHYHLVAIYTQEEDDLLTCRSCSPVDDNTHAKFNGNENDAIRWVANQKTELYIEDTNQHPIYQSIKAPSGTHSEVILPLMIGNRLLGVLDVHSRDEKAFHEMDRIVLRILADNIAIAMEGSRLFSNLNRQTEQISTIFDISQALSSILDLDILLEEVAKTIQQKFNYLQVNVYTVHEGRGKIFYRAGTGLKNQAYRDAFPVFNIDDEKGILPWVAREAKTFLSNDVLSEPQYRLPEFLCQVTRSELSVPLIAAGQVVGILDIQSDREKAFDRNDVFLFEALSAGVATSIRNATLFRSEQFRRLVAEGVRDIAGILSNGSTLEELMDRILEKLQELLPCDAASIWLSSTGPQNIEILKLSSSLGFEPEKTTRIINLSGNQGGLIIKAFQSGEPQIRTPMDPIGPLGNALGFSRDYSSIAAPLRVGGKTVGVLTLAHHQNDRYGSEALLITQTLAGYAAVAIQNNRLFAETREQVWVASVLLKVAESNKKAKSQTELLETTVRLIPELTGCSSCAFYFFNPQAGLFERKATTGFPSDSLPARTFNKNHPTFLFARKILSPVTANYSNGEFSLSPHPDSHPGVLLPMVVREQLLGMIWVGGISGEFALTPDILQVLTGISDQTATAIENLQLLENQQLDAFISAALLQVAQSVSSTNNLKSSFDSILGHLRILAGIDTAAFFLWQNDRECFQPMSSNMGLNPEVIRSFETNLFPGDFPLLDLVVEKKKVYLSPLNARQQSATHWTTARHAMRLKDASQKMPPEWGWLVGIPLMGRGQVLGALMLIEKPVTGTLLEKRMELLAGIARQAGLVIQNEGLQEEKFEKEKLQQEFHFAREIQQTFLPRKLPPVRGWDVAHLWQPANQVGGDFFDFFLIQPEVYCAVIADVSDKGMPAALYMTVTRTLVRSFAQENLSPGQILKKVNDLLLQDNPTGMFVTSAIIIGSRESGSIRYANAGHNPPLICRPDHLIEELPKGQVALGVLDGQDYTDHIFDVDLNSFIILYTDGVTDTSAPDGRYYSLERLKKLIGGTHFKQAKNLTSALENDLIQFKSGFPSVDDITVLALRRF